MIRFNQVLLLAKLLCLFFMVSNGVLVRQSKALAPFVRQAQSPTRHQELQGLQTRTSSNSDDLENSKSHDVKRNLSHSTIQKTTRRSVLVSCLGMVVTISGNYHKDNKNVAWALSPKQAADAYDSYATSYNELDGGSAASMLGINEARSQLFQQAKGRVLEIGVGTGLNLDHYNGNKIDSLTLVDISEGMLNQARERVASLSNLKDVNVKFIKADATCDLVDMFGKDAFDTVVDTFSLCVMGNDGAKGALQQMSQVVKSNCGRMLLLENSRSSNSVLGWYQDLTANTAAMAGGKGCVYNQDVAALIRETKGLTIVEEVPFATGVFRSFQISKN